jgi:hypothetical protein
MFARFTLVSSAEGDRFHSNAVRFSYSRFPHRMKDFTVFAGATIGFAYTFEEFLTG